MTHHRKNLWMLPLLASSLVLTLAVSANAQERHDQERHDSNYGQNRHDQQSTDTNFQVNFTTAPHWTTVRGTHVREIRQGERPDYDMFRYGRNYYVYNNNQWYRSGRSNGEFTVIDERSVPSELSRVPRQHWHNYPSQWSDRDNNSRWNRHHRDH